MAIWFEWSPGLIFFKGHVFEGLIFGGAYVRREICVSKSARLYTGREIYVSKSIGLAYSWKEIYVSKLQKVFIETPFKDVDFTKTQPCEYFEMTKSKTRVKSQLSTPANSNILSLKPVLMKLDYSSRLEKEFLP